MPLPGDQQSNSCRALHICIHQIDEHRRLQRIDKGNTRVFITRNRINPQWSGDYQAAILDSQVWLPGACS